MLSASFEESGDRYKGKSRDFILLRTLNNDLFSDISLFDYSKKRFFLRYFRLSYYFFIDLQDDR